jgi:hypothetical protein
MQVTMKRNVRFMGEMRKAGDTLNITIGDKMGEITPRNLQSLIDGGTLEADGMGMSQTSGASAHIRAQLDALSDKHKRLVASNEVLQKSHDDLAKRVAGIEGLLAKAVKAAPGEPGPKSRRDARKE